MKSIGVFVFRAAYLAVFSFALAIAAARVVFFTTKAEAFLADWNFYTFSAVAWLASLVTFYGIREPGGYRRRVIGAVLPFIIISIFIAAGFAYYHEHYYDFPEVKGFDWLPIFYTIMPIPSLLVVSFISIGQKRDACVYPEKNPALAE